MMIEWGPALTGPECKQLRLPGDTPVMWGDIPGTASCLMFVSEIDEYFLPANHPAYKVAEYNRKNPEAPMVYHGGSEEAPKDWTPGDDVLFGNGLVPDPRRDWAWGREGELRSFNIIGYVSTPVEETVEESDTVTLKRMTQGEWHATVHGNRGGYTGWALSVGLIREETLLEQFERETRSNLGQKTRKVAQAAIEWMEKRRGDNA